MPFDWPYPFWIAHRGAGRHAPENTLAALREGAAQGFRMFECDVKLSADEVPFLLHDTTLDRTTEGAGRAGDLPWRELAALDAGGWQGPAHAGEPLPTLDAVAAFAIDAGCAANLEIKPSEGTERRTGELVAHAAARLWEGRAPAPLLSSFSAEALEAAAIAAPGLPRALLLAKLRAGWFERATALGVRAVIMHFPLMDEPLVDRLHAAGWRALVYTVNRPSDVAWLTAAGVDGIITDEVRRFSAEARGSIAA